jgi:molybdenum cofactor cytidylyltransferase
VNRDEQVVAVVLAAGSSRRFQSDKRFAQLPGGFTLLQASLGSLGSEPDAIYVVIRPGESGSARFPASTPGSEICYLVSERSEAGMGHSLADAVRQLPADCHVLVALGDMPYVRQNTVRELLQHFRQSRKAAPIVFPLCEKPGGNDGWQRGHPVIFHRGYRKELEALEGDRGASSILNAHQDAHDPVRVNDQGVLSDIDRPGDLVEP